MHITTRYATPADAGIIHRFVCELESRDFDREKFHAYYLRNIQTEHYHYLVAETNNAIAGYISCHGQVLLHHLGWVYEIQELFVDTQYRGLGIGKILVDGILEILQPLGYDMLEVASGLQRTASHEFYKHVGFGQTHYKFTLKGNVI